MAIEYDRLSLRTPHGTPITLHTRGDTADNPLAHGVLGEDEYQLASRSFSGTAIDLGAHIGIVAVALLADNADLRVICIEPLPENLHALRLNVAPYGSRATVIEAAAGKARQVTIGYSFGGIELPENYAHGNRFMGRHMTGKVRNVDTVTVPGLTLAKVLDDYDLDEVALVKTDCEGGEYAFFTDPRANARCAVIFGEYHDDDGSRITKLLQPTHDMVRIEANGGCGLFEAVRR